MVSDTMVKTMKGKYAQLRDVLDERSRRLWAASEAMALGHGGVAAVSRATGPAERTIRAGREQLQQAKKRKKGKRTSALEDRIRRTGGGRKRLTEHDRKLKEALDALVEPTARGDPMCPLRWTCKSTRRLALELTR